MWEQIEASCGRCEGCNPWVWLGNNLRLWCLLAAAIWYTVAWLPRLAASPGARQPMGRAAIRLAIPFVVGAVLGVVAWLPGVLINRLGGGLGDLGVISTNAEILWLRTTGWTLLATTFVLAMRLMTRRPPGALQAAGLLATAAAAVHFGLPWLGETLCGLTPQGWLLAVWPFLTSILQLALGIQVASASRIG